jgi:hypothetical protein
VIKSNGKKRARLEAMRHVLRLFEYPGKAVDVATDPDPKVFGPAWRTGRSRCLGEPLRPLTAGR